MNGGLLIDTHIFVWARLRPGRLTAGEGRALDEALIRYVSAVNLWEIAILQGLRRIETHPELLQVPEEFELLPLRPEHCRALLQLSRHHRDPFDRMLIAQARGEGLSLLTRDRQIAAYGDEATILHFPGA